jgi:hypothetical protein
MRHRVFRFIILGLVLFSGQALSKDETIWFYFKHEPNPLSKTLLSFHLTKGGHYTDSFWLHPGQTDLGSTTNSFLAPTPSGTYNITISCHRYYSYWKSYESHKKITWEVAPHSKPIHIQALCPDRIIGNDLAPPENIKIDVEK